MKQFTAPWYTLTIFVSSILLFSVQPMISKTILPVLGGGAHIWIVSVLFFQILLMLGYGYAHLLHVILPHQTRKQVIIHGALVLGGCLALPIMDVSALPEPDYQNPIYWQLLALLKMIGLPFFILSISAPLFQKWYSCLNVKHADDPYFLYGASNAGSLLALLLYPFIIEGYFGLNDQHDLWFYGYIILVVLAGIAIMPFILNTTNGAQALSTLVKNKAVPDTPQKQKLFACSWRQWAQWVFWAAIPSSLMLGLTTVVTSDIASIPLFWVVPLALYLLTYVVTFNDRFEAYFKYIDETYMTLAITSVMISLGGSVLGYSHIALYIVTFICVALALHRKLYITRPQTTRLTEFYLAIAVGGAIGGLFNSLGAPLLFDTIIEFYIVLALSLLAPLFMEGYKFERLRHNPFTKLSLLSIIGVVVITVVFNAMGYMNASALLTALGIIGILLFFLIMDIWILALPLVLAVFLIPHGLSHQVTDYEVIHTHRNFYGASVVLKHKETLIYKLVHGTTLHGYQYRDGANSTTPLSYYGEGTGLHDVMNYFDDKNKPERLAAVGLGVGTLSCYGNRKRHIDFYEIDPDMVTLANNPELFTYLDLCPHHDITLGDGRVQLSKSRTGLYDGIILDAFSSDSIPVHLLTLDAIKMYQTKLKTDGYILFHISNRYLDLSPVLSRIFDELGWVSYHKKSTTQPSDTPASLETTDTVDINALVSQTHYLIGLPNAMAEEMDFYLRFRDWQRFDQTPDTPVPLWTDDKAQLLDAFK